jgi:hypothetical protein
MCGSVFLHCRKLFRWLSLRDQSFVSIFIFFCVGVNNILLYKVYKILKFAIEKKHLEDVILHLFHHHTLLKPHLHISQVSSASVFVCVCRINRKTFWPLWPFSLADDKSWTAKGHDHPV